MAEINIQPKNLEIDIHALFGNSIQEMYLQRIISELEKKVNGADNADCAKDIDNV